MKTITTALALFRTSAIALTVLVLLCSGCTGTGLHRPEQTLSVRVNGEQSREYKLFLSVGDERIPFEESDGVHTVELPGVSYSNRSVFVIPVSDFPEKDEYVIFSRDGKDLDGMSVQNVRYAGKTKDGVYLIRLR